MLLGKVPGGGFSPIVTSAPKSPPKVNNPDELSEVIVTAQKRLTSTAAPVEEDLPEIVVTGTRIPWFAWVAAGVAGFALLDSLLGRRKA